ncbi:MAG: NupC/NupG family nucleoside CNT transporter [Deltaproteobacteria bacterium]|nr:NupC/NupG family nucleoside CNT transporter [Deltaproteobacteria bacterium]MBW2072609.1 NupC/NupG family nucleoside CNT transporter [Deltaproteobacteria bacterium]
MERFISLLGIPALLLIAFLFCTDRKKIPYKTIGGGIGLQFLLALLVLRTNVGREIFRLVGHGAERLIGFTLAGSKFVFGDLTAVDKVGFVVAVQVLPVIVFFSSLSAILYHFGILQWLVRQMARVFTRTLGISGAEALSAAANVFVGMVEAPLLIRPYIEEMTESELFCVMSVGMATIAGSVMAAYIGILQPHFPNVAGHILAASLMSAPAGIVVAKIMVPESGTPRTAGRVNIIVEKRDVNFIDAAARGATDGMHLAIAVAAMLIAFIALVAMVNGVFSLMHTSFEAILGWLFAPIAFVMGVPWKEALQVGSLLGQKTVLNEFVAYLNLANGLASGKLALSPRSITIATYALCGFANFGSLGIMIAGISGMAPSRRHDLARLGIRSIISGSLAAFLTATIAGVLIR